MTAMLSPGTFGHGQTLSLGQIAMFAKGFFWTFAWLQLALVLLLVLAMPGPVVDWFNATAAR